MSISALNIATAGLSRNLSSASDAASRIVRGTSQPASTEPGADTTGVAATEGEILNAILDLKTAEVGFKASASVFRTADEMSGTLMDILV